MKPEWVDSWLNEDYKPLQEVIIKLKNYQMHIQRLFCKYPFGMVVKLKDNNIEENPDKFKRIKGKEDVKLYAMNIGPLSFGLETYLSLLHDPNCMCAVMIFNSNLFEIIGYKKGLEPETLTNIFFPKVERVRELILPHWYMDWVENCDDNFKSLLNHYETIPDHLKEIAILLPFGTVIKVKDEIIEKYEDSKGKDFYYVVIGYNELNNSLVEVATSPDVDHSHAYVYKDDIEVIGYKRYFEPENVRKIIISKYN